MMSNRQIYVSLLIMSLTVYAIRAIPFIIFRREISNKWVRSFLYYVPYVTLAVMTFPAILSATSSTWSGVIALAVGVTVAVFGGDLFTVAICACVAVFLSELFLI